MKCIFLLIVFSLNSNILLFSQDSLEMNEKKTVKYDSLWCFSAFSIDLAAGVWIPIGTLATYYLPSYQFAGSLGIGTSSGRIQLWIAARDYRSKKELPIIVTDTNSSVKANGIGASLGGFISMRVYANRSVCVETNGGITWEAIPVVVKMPFRENDSLDISGIGFSIGFTMWINTWKRLNFGIRGMYTYSTFSNSSYITSPIGNHLTSLALTYRFPKRSVNCKK